MTTKNKKPKTILFWSLGIVLVVLFTFLTVETATSGAVLAKLEDEESSLLQQNKELEEAIVKASSLNDLENRSSELGFAKSSQILYISGSSEVAKLP